MSDHERDDDGGNLVLDRPPTEERQRLEPPPLYAVIFLNDDFTPMDFVVAVLVQIFQKSVEEAEAIMLAVHNEGKAMVARYPKDIAETRCLQVNQLAASKEHPFRAEVQALH